MPSEWRRGLQRAGWSAARQIQERRCGRRHECSHVQLILLSRSYGSVISRIIAGWGDRQDGPGLSQSTEATPSNHDLGKAVLFRQQALHPRRRQASHRHPEGRQKKPVHQKWFWPDQGNQAPMCSWFLRAWIDTERWPWASAFWEDAADGKRQAGEAGLWPAQWEAHRLLR